jgi:hypothetical protein
MKDFEGNELFVGDKVIFVQSHYTDLKRGIVTRVGLVKATISFGEGRYDKTWKTGDQIICPSKIQRDHADGC